MPLGSESALGLAGPNGTPLIGELPAPADPAGGVSCAKACAGTIRLPSAKARTSAELRGIQVSPGCSFNDDVGAAFPHGRRPCLFAANGRAHLCRVAGCKDGSTIVVLTSIHRFC
jgi:hypothetical protein